MIGIQPISLFRTSPKIATGLRQQSLRSYDRCRYGTDRHGCSPAPRATVFWWLENDRLVHWQFAELTL